MRILIANDGYADAGGVHSYLTAIVPGLRARGLDVGFLHCGSADQETSSGFSSAGPCFAVSPENPHAGILAARRWDPDLIFSHNMGHLNVEEELLAMGPVFKLMHGYFGSCISGLKMRGWRQPQPCDRQFGLGCLLRYLPCRCGQIDPRKMLQQFRWAQAQKQLWPRYQSVIVASAHMKREYVANGLAADKVAVNPLFSTLTDEDRDEPTGREGKRPQLFDVLFLGRMTRLKGGDVLIDAIARASARLGRPLRLALAGDGPQRHEWEACAKSSGVTSVFLGWLDGVDRTEAIRQSAVLAVPSVWPEPFGLIGLEAGRLGVPTVAFDVGGISEWLADGVNGWLVPARPPSAASFADALVRIFAQPDQLGVRGQAAWEVAQRLSLSAHLDRLQEKFASCCTTMKVTAGI